MTATDLEAERRQFGLTDAERALLPTEEEVASYHARGWYITRKVLADDEVDAMAAAVERFYAGHRDRTLPVRPPNIAYWEPSQGDTFRCNDYSWYECAGIGAVATKAIVGAIAALLTGTDQIRILNCSLLYKPSRADDRSTHVPWHVDKHYWRNHTSNRLLTAFIPFQGVDERNGTPIMIDGSHRWSDSATDDGTRHFIDRDPATIERSLEATAHRNGGELRRVPMVIPKGHMSFHSGLIYHGSGPNRSGLPRQAIGLHLQDRDNRWQPHTLSTGESLVYNHDHLVRRTASGEPDYADPEFCPVIWEGDPRG